MFHPLGDIRGLRSTKMSSFLGSNNFWTVRVFIVAHLLWHGISVFLVYPREPPHEIWRLLTRSLIVNGSYDPRPRQKFNYNTQTVVLRISLNVGRWGHFEKRLRWIPVGLNAILMVFSSGFNIVLFNGSYRIPT